MNRENPCDNGMCWPPANDSGTYNDNRYYPGSGTCIKGNATPTISSMTTYTTASNENYNNQMSYDDTLTQELSFNTGDYNTDLIFQPEIITNSLIYNLSSGTPYYWIYIGLLKKPVNMVNGLNVPASAYKPNSNGPSPSPTSSCPQATYNGYKCSNNNCYKDNGATCIDISGSEISCDAPLDRKNPSKYDQLKDCYNICKQQQKCGGFVIGQVGNGDAGNCGLRQNINIDKCQPDENYKTYIKS